MLQGQPGHPSQSSPVSFPLTQQDLGGHLGTSRDLWFQASHHPTSVPTQTIHFPAQTLGTYLYELS